jgi:non-ribosomal peptide synthetase component E (peptide arylation enzyme)
MILGDPALAVQHAQHERRVAIDEVFRHVATRRPGALAPLDAPSRETFTDGQPLRLTFAEADRMVWAIAGRLRRMGLPTDSVVGIQMPNTVEKVLTILGVLRAGLIAAPLPLLWRRSEAAAALTRAGAQALITCARAGGFDYAQLAIYVAADVFSIRYVCGFGPDLPDGVVAFDIYSRRRSSIRYRRSNATGRAMLSPTSRSSLSMSARTARCRSHAVISNCWRAACARSSRAGLSRTPPFCRRFRLPRFPESV